MNLTISGHHLEVTPALRMYVTEKLDRITRQVSQGRERMRIAPVVEEEAVAPTRDATGATFFDHERTDLY